MTEKITETDMSDNDSLLVQANMLFAGHSYKEVIVALTMLAAFTFGTASENEDEAYKLTDDHAHDIKKHIMMNWEHIRELRARMDLPMGNA